MKAPRFASAITAAGWQTILRFVITLCVALFVGLISGRTTLALAVFFAGGDR